MSTFRLTPSVSRRNFALGNRKNQKNKHKNQKIMSSKTTSVVTIFSGLVGGCSKVAQEVEKSAESIDFIKVIIAAAVSAAVGYLVKLLFDAIIRAIKKQLKR
jgi:hypothetical protein